MIAGIIASTRRFQGGGFVIKTTDGTVVAIKGPGVVSGTDVYIDADGYIGGDQLEEVLSWPEEKPVWLEGNGVKFYEANYLTKVPDALPAWITDMASMFYYCSNFNQDISGWDTSNVTAVHAMADMFYGCTSFNQDLSGWCVIEIPSEPEGFSDNTPSWTLPKPIWGTCPQEDSGGESGPDLGPGPWDIDPEHPEYFIPGRYIVSGSGSNFPGYAYIGTGSTPEAACNGLRSAMWGQLKDGVHSNQDAHNNRLTKDGQWCRIGTIWDDRITEAYIYDGIDAYIASGRDPMSAVRYANGDEE